MEYKSNNWKFVGIKEASSLSKLSGLYMPAEKSNQAIGKIHYIGKADDLNAWLSSHDRKQEAISGGADTIYYQLISNKSELNAEEGRLINKYKPSLNVQFK